MRGISTVRRNVGLLGPIERKVELKAFRLLARVADRTVFQKHLASRQCLLLFLLDDRFPLRPSKDEFHRSGALVLYRDIAWRVRIRRQMFLVRRPATLQREERLQIPDPVFLSGSPKYRISFASSDRERFLRPEADNRVVTTSPFLGECPDVEIHSRQRPKNADTIRSI